MRKALWVFSAPLVAGSLTWAISLADERPSGKLLPAAGAAQKAPAAAKGQKGSVYYFSRGKTAPAAAAPAVVEIPATKGEPEDIEAPATQGVQRSVRNRVPATAPAAIQQTGGASTAAGKNLPPNKNKLYHELFDSGAAPENRVIGAAATAKAAAKPQAADGAVAEECAIPAGSKADVAGKNPLRETVKLPPADTEHVPATTDKKSTVVPAKYERPQGASTEQQIQPVSHPGQPVTASTIAPPPGARVVKRIPGESAEDKTPAAAAADSAKPAAATKPAGASQGKLTVVGPAKPVSPVAAGAKSAIPAAVRTTASDESAALESQSPALTLRWAPLEKFSVGQECKCTLLVKNSGNAAAQEVVVEAFFPRTVRLMNADPFPADSRDHLVWKFDQFAAGEEKSIQVTMVPSKRGEAPASATVRFTGAAATLIKVEEPQIQIAIKGPHEVQVGEAATQVVTISNPGSGIAQDIVLQAIIPEGLEHPRGKKLELAIGSLAGGESRDVRLPLAAISGGEHSLTVEARGGSGLVQQATTSIKIIAPKLEVALAGPGLRYINRHAQYTVTVANKGSAATSNVRVVEQVPQGFEFAKADKGGKFDATARTVTWFLGQIEAGQTLQLQVELAAKQIGSHEHHVQVSGESGAVADARVQTRVDGVSALVMEVADSDDPVEVNSQTGYEIKVRNDGSKAAQNIVISCELPEGVELAEGTGPTKHTVVKGLLTFAPLAELPPQQSVTFRVRVTGRVAGNLRFRAKLTSVSSPEPLVVEELTKFYAD